MSLPRSTYTNIMDDPNVDGVKYLELLLKERAQSNAPDAVRKIQQWWLMRRFIKWLPERRRYRQWLRDTFEYLEPDL